MQERNMGVSAGNPIVQQPFGQLATINSGTGIPKRSSARMRIETTATQAGTVQVQRARHDGTFVNATAGPTNVAAGGTDVQEFMTVFPCRVQYANTDNVAGTARFTMIENERP